MAANGSQRPQELARFERIAREHPRASLPLGASPEERAAALRRVLGLAEALRRPGGRHRSEARDVHLVIARGRA